MITKDELAAGGVTNFCGIGWRSDGSLVFDADYPADQRAKAEAVISAHVDAYSSYSLKHAQDTAILLCRDFCNKQIYAMYSVEHQANVHSHCTLRLARWAANLPVPEGLYTADNLATMINDINQVRAVCFDACQHIQTLTSPQAVQDYVSTLCVQYGVPNVQL